VCPLDVFEQLFHEHHGDEYFAGVVRFIDWANVEWEDIALSGVAGRGIVIEVAGHVPPERALDLISEPQNGT
jgi:hypothetical protein